MKTLSGAQKMAAQLDHERATRLPSSLEPKGTRPKFFYRNDAIRWTPKYPTLSQMDGERQ